ncbi:MAG: 3-oxoacyl-ACP reductase, partial [Aeromicrobium sp.]
MSDRYQSLAHNPIGKFLVKNLGLPNPPYLERWEEGAPLVNGTVLLGAAKGSTLGNRLADTLSTSGIKIAAKQVEGDKYKGLVFDATGIDDTAGLVAIAN